MNTAFKIIFGFILVLMIVLNIQASLRENLFELPAVVTGDPWFQVTVSEAYLAFIPVYAWVFYRSHSLWEKLFWFVGIFGFGNAVISLYILIQLFALPKDATFEDLLIKRNSLTAQGEPS